MEEQDLELQSKNVLDTLVINPQQIDSSYSEENAEVDAIEQDSICIYYNEILKHLYPDRKLLTEHADERMKVAPEAQENVEGGGMSTKYLNIKNKDQSIVGVVLFEDRYSALPITLSLAIMKKENILINTKLVDINGSTLLLTLSKESNPQEMKPFHYNYYTYDDALNRFPVFTKKNAVDGEPILSQIEKETLLKNMNSKDHSIISNSDFEKIYKGDLINTNLKYFAIIDELKGLEKYYVQNDLFKLHSLLKFKKDMRYQALENHLNKQFEHASYFNIQTLDMQNGYVEFESLEANECTKLSMCYWKESNGDILIGHIMNCCTMFCESDISFKGYSKNYPYYTTVRNKIVIPEIDYLKTIKPDGHIDGDGYDEKYILPKEGKNIRYCVETKCTELVWKDGTFSITKE